MLFVAGLSNLSRDELLTLLAQLNAINNWNVLSQGVQQGARRIRDSLFRASEWIAHRVGGESAVAKLSSLDEKTRFAPEVLQKRIGHETVQLGKLTLEELRARLRIRLTEIAALKRPHSDDVTANAILHRASRALGLDVRLYLTASSLEKAVFESVVRDMIDQLKIHLEHMEPEDVENLADILQQELDSLSSTDLESLRAILALHELCPAALIQSLKTTSSTAISLSVVSGFSNGGHLYLTVFVRAVSLLLGVTLPISKYLTANNLYSFSLTIPFLLLALSICGGLIYRMNTLRVEDELAKALVVAGRARLLAK